MNEQRGFQYDVFISYRWVEPDKSWVREQLAPALKEAGLNVCLDIEDFAPGKELIMEMERAGQSSRHVICVLSPDYFNDNGMVNFEILMARRSDPGGNDSRLIPLVLRETTIPERLGGLIPIDWTRPDNLSKEWKKLLKTLNAGNIDSPFIPNTGKIFTNSLNPIENRSESNSDSSAVPARAIITNTDLHVLHASPYSPPENAPVDGCLASAHRDSGLLKMKLVSFDGSSERFGAVEILFAFFFGLFLCGINIWQRHELLWNGPNPPSLKDIEHFWGAVILNLSMGSSIFFLTAEILLYLNRESVKISLFIEGITRRLVFAYLFALCGIEVISHSDSFLKDPLALLIIGQLIFFTTNAIEAFIDLKVAVCFRKIGYHYKNQETIYSRAGKWAIWVLFGNFLVSVLVIMANMNYFWKFDER
jgi:hypothetical protein